MFRHLHSSDWQTVARFSQRRTRNEPVMGAHPETQANPKPQGLTRFSASFFGLGEVAVGRRGNWRRPG